MQAAHARLSLAMCFCLTAALGCDDAREAPGSDDREKQDAAADDTRGPPRGTATGDAALDARAEPALDGDLERDADAALLGSDAGLAVDQPTANADGGRGMDAALSSTPTVVRGDPSATYWDLRVRGVDLGRFEGKEAVVRLGNLESGGERLAFASVRIVDGSFELFFAQAWEKSLYKLKRAYIDVNANGRCDDSQDMVFFDARATKVDFLEVRADRSMSPTEFTRAFDPAEDCAALNARWPNANAESL